MSNMQYMNIGGFVLGVPQDKMFEVATLQVDIRPAIKNLQHESVRWSLDKTPIKKTPASDDSVLGQAPQVSKAHYTRYKCRKGCKNTFIKSKTRRTHERKYHAPQPPTKGEN